ncbi:hypothetical protein BJY01DRAFT_255757 [Aspergillus pseudoustus]|uniref:Uncharacterized protein n=1 Tax=Aspergillus pseudoustus TaxID=1810923 RepID=A0ABR4IHQ4_9EURO
MVSLGKPASILQASRQKLQDLAKNPELGGNITRLVVSVKKDAYKYPSKRDGGKRTVALLGQGFKWKRDNKGNLILHQEAVSEVFNKNEFTNCCKFTSACSQLTSLTLTGSGYALEDGQFANLVLAAENLKGLAIYTKIIPDELLEPIAASAKRPALEEVSFSGGMIKDGKYFGKQIMPFLSSMCDSLETIGGFCALNQVVFDQVNLRDPGFAFLCFSGRLARQTVASATPTGFTYVALSQKEYDDLLKRFNLYVNTVTLDNTLFRKVGLSSPKDLIKLEEMADITRW